MEGEDHPAGHEHGKPWMGDMAKYLLYFSLFWVHQTSSSQLRDSNSVISDHTHPTATLQNSSCTMLNPWSVHHGEELNAKTQCPPRSRPRKTDKTTDMSLGTPDLCRQVHTCSLLFLQQILNS